MLTLVIPTRNRWAFLERLLTYYANQKFSYPILIGDSSDAECHVEGKRIVESFSNRLRVNLYSYPEISAFPCTVGLLDRVLTPYVAIAADDDFVIPAGIERGIDFLESHHDYTVATGTALLMAVSSDQPYGSIIGSWPYGQSSIEHTSASSRLLHGFSHYYPTTYPVHRTEAMRVSYKAVTNLDLDNGFGELLPCLGPIIHGKRKKIRGLYMVRQAHMDMTSRKLNPDLFDWVCNPQWADQAEKFQSYLAQELAVTENLTADTSRKVVKQAFWSWLEKGLSHKWTVNYSLEETVLRVRLREVRRQWPVLDRIWRQVKSFFPGERNQALLAALLRSSSPYHKDFMPIYRVVVGASEESEVVDSRPEG